MIDNENIVTSTVEKDDRQRIKTWTEETRDDDGILISRRIDTYSYYPTGEVDRIVLRKFDGENNLVDEKVVKHSVKAESQKPNNQFISAFK
jgi:hypothetical protein